MLYKFEFCFALHYLKFKGAEGIIALCSFLGILIGVGAIIFISSVMNGFHNELLNRILGINGHVNIISEDIEEYSSINEELKNIQGVEYSIPYVIGEAIVSNERGMRTIMVKGMQREDLIYHNFLDPNYNFDEGVLIGIRLAEKMGISKGDNISIIIQNKYYTVHPKTTEVPVGGIFDTGIFPYDNGLMFMPLDIAMDMFAKKGANDIEIYLNDPENISNVTLNDIISISGHSVLTWKDKEKNLLLALQIERQVMFIILSLIILVASFNIISSMLMLVRTKNKEIAILRSMGVSRSSIVRIFLMSGSLIGVLGTIFGTITGIGLVFGMEMLKDFIVESNSVASFIYSIFKDIPIILLYEDIFKISSIAVTLSFLATIYPAFEATKVEPASILRYE